VAISVCVLICCWKLPNNFASLPLGQKIDAYASRFKDGGARDYNAEELISAHGFSAAEAMAPYISGRGGISPFIAINIAWDVQSRGCDLRGSAAEDAMKHLLLTGRPQADERVAAEAALRAIINVKHSSPASRQLSVDACRPR
jgi:hypothetical protein